MRLDCSLSAAVALLTLCCAGSGFAQGTPATARSHPSPLIEQERRYVGTVERARLVHGNALENIELVENPARNFVVIMKDGKTCRNLLAP